jgi:hypothetical protein
MEEEHDNDDVDDDEDWLTKMADGSGSIGNV